MTIYSVGCRACAFHEAVSGRAVARAVAEWHLAYTHPGEQYASVSVKGAGQGRPSIVRSKRIRTLEARGDE